MLIDVSSGIGEWAFDSLDCSTAGALDKAMRDEGVDLALVSPLEGICHKNPHIIIQKHFERLRPFSKLIPVPVINPCLGDSAKQVESACGAGAPAVKLYPNYHGYPPQCAHVQKILELCGQLGMAVMFQTRVEDPRRQHKVLNVPNVPLQSILDAIEPCTETKVLLCGLSSIDEEERTRIINRENTFIDTSFLEYLDTLNAPGCSLNHCYERIMFGTHSPFFYIRANILKLSSIADRQAVLDRVTFKNAAEALGLRGIW